MLISKRTPINTIEIFTPRYHDRVVLVAKYKVKQHNKIVFTKAKHLKGKEYYLSQEQAQKYPINSNGRIDCYAVKLDDLDILEYKEDVRDIAKSLFAD